MTRIYFEGLPLATAALYGEEAVEPLLAMLADPEQLPYHENIALTLGMIGSERAVEPLIAYALKGTGEAAAARWRRTIRRRRGRPSRARVGAIIGLGYIANQTADERALAFLKESAAPGQWEQRG